MTQKTNLSLKGAGKPHKRPQVTSGGTTGYANQRWMAEPARGRKENIGGGTANTYFANSKATGTHQRNSNPVGPTSYTNFSITKKGRQG